MSIPNVKKFVSATEIEEQRQKRQEEWEKVRKPDQPLGETWQLAWITLLATVLGKLLSVNYQALIYEQGPYNNIIIWLTAAPGSR